MWHVFCERCGDGVAHLSADGLCDGCVADDKRLEREYTVTHTISQTVEADSPEEAERIARAAIEASPTLWWVSVPDPGQVS